MKYDLEGIQKRMDVRKKRRAIGAKKKGQIAISLKWCKGNGMSLTKKVKLKTKNYLRIGKMQGEIK